MIDEMEKEIFNILKNNIFIDKSGYSGELQIAGIFKTAELLSKREAEKDRRIEEAVRILEKGVSEEPNWCNLNPELCGIYFNTILEAIEVLRVLKGEK